MLSLFLNNWLYSLNYWKSSILLAEWGLEQFSLKFKCAKDPALLLQLPAKTQNTKALNFLHLLAIQNHTFNTFMVALPCWIEQKTYPPPIHTENTKKVENTNLCEIPNLTNMISYVVRRTQYRISKGLQIGLGSLQSPRSWSCCFDSAHLALDCVCFHQQLWDAFDLMKWSITHRQWPSFNG